MAMKKSSQPKRWLIAIVLIVFFFSLVSIFTRILNKNSENSETDDIIIEADKDGETADTISNASDFGNQMQRY